jgi:YD repeat-containing protein
MELRMTKTRLLIGLFLFFLPAQLLAASANVNIATGSLHQDIDLFELEAAGLPATMDITYESMSPNTVHQGRGWAHTFDIYLKDNGSTFLQKDLYGNQYVYHVKDGEYIPGSTDKSTLIKEKDGSYSINRNGLSYQYDSNCQLTKIIDQYGAVTTFIFANHKLLRVNTEDKKTITFDYGDGDRLVRVTDPHGKSYTITYDDISLAAITYPDGTAWRFTYYDSLGLMLTKTNRQGRTVTYHYDDRKRLISTINYKGSVDTWSYPNQSNDRVKTTTFSHNGEVEDLSYDLLTGRSTKEVDPRGNVTTFTNDDLGNRTSATDPSGRTTFYTYDKDRRLASTRDPEGNLKTYQYDAHGNVVAETDPVQGTVRFEYNAKGQMIKSIGPHGKVFSYVYDAKGKPVTLIGPDGETLQLPQKD